MSGIRKHYCPVCQALLPYGLKLRYCSVLCSISAKSTGRYLNECWEWTAGSDQWGYGQVGWNKKKFRVSRAVYSAIHGDIHPKQFVCHHCDNPPCFNPLHLFLGTQADNLADMRRKGRNTAIPYGESAYNVKLTTSDVLEIRRRMSDGSISGPKLAREFGVQSPAIYAIKHRRNWKHI
jgi:hypothetical protein